MGTFLRLKEALEQQLEQLSGLPDIKAATIQGLLDKLRQNRFHLVVLGAFKRGKSTLINALLGEALLPVAIVPLTSVVTILGYGEHLTIQVLFRDGRRHQISREELVDYITEKGNPQNQKGVLEVEITYPSEYLKDGVRIIDTPGVGSVYSHNTEIAYNYLPQVDAAVFVVTVDPPLSAAEQEFLKDVREYVHKLFFVLNKIDYVEEADRREALDFTTQVLKDNLGQNNVKLFSVSAKMALEGKSNERPEILAQSLLPQFEEYLRDFLYRSKGRVLLLSCVSNALKAIADSTLALKVERQAGSLPLQELEAKIARFESELQGIEKEREMSLFLLDGRLQGVTKTFDQDLETFKRETTERLRREIAAAFQEKSQRSPDLRKDMEDFLFASLRDLFTGWRRQEINKLTDLLADTHQDFAGRINAILGRLTQLTARIFDFDLRGFAVEETFEGRSRFSFKFKEEPVGLEILQMTVTGLLPRALTKGLLLKKVQDNVVELVDKHCGRLRWDFHQRLQEMAREFRQDWLSRIDDTTQSIRQALERARLQKQTSAQDINLRLSRLNETLDRVVRLEGRLVDFREKIEATLH